MDDSPRAAVKQATSRSKVAAVAVGVVVAIHAVSIPCLLVQLDILERFAAHDRPAAADVASSDSHVNAVGSLGTIAWWISGILFLRWVASAHRAAARIGVAGRAQPTPSQVVWGYFIPIVSFVRPYQNMATLAWLSDPSDLELPPLRRANPAPGYREAPTREVPRAPWVPPRAFVGAWWAAYVVMSMFLIAVRLSARKPGDVAGAIFTTMFGILHEVLLIVTGVLCISVIRGISRCQQERARRLAILERAANG